MRNPPPQGIRLADYRPPDFLIDSVDLDISLHRSKTRVVSRLAIRRNPKGRPGAELTLDGDGLVLRRLLLDGASVAAEATPDALTLHATPDAPFVLEIETEVDPAANTQLSGLYRSGSAYCTQCEAEGFRRITYFLDRPDVLSVFTTRIEADVAEAPVLLGNGNRIDAGALEGGRHFALWRDPFPKPSYLFALVGGDLSHISERFATRSGRMVDLAIYVEHGKEKYASYAMDSLIRSMRWDEEVFGREYDLDVFNIVAVSDFNMGAMENKGLNIFNDKYVLASPETATDGDYAGVESVIAHEYFHNWTGNRITCRDWFQLCLKEGLTVFRDQEFSADQRSRAVKRISDVRGLRLQQFPEDAGPLAHSVRPNIYHEINNFYTATVYEKGAEIIRMLKTLIGADDFAKGMTLYFDRFDGTAATIEDFLSCFAEASGRDLSQFSLWYEQAGTPLVTVESDYDAAAKRLTLSFEQSTPATPGQSEKKPFVIPLALGLIGENGDEIPLVSREAGAQECERGLIELTTQKRVVAFENVGSHPVVSLLRGFSAPVRLAPPQAAEDLQRLLAHDSDPFNRWQAAQSLALRSIFARIEAARGGPAAEADGPFFDALGRLVEAPERDPSLVAQALSLPSDIDIAREIGRDVDPDVIFSARSGLRRDLGRRLSAALADARARLVPAEGFSPDAGSAGRRALRNAALDLIAAGDPGQGGALAERQFGEATNMTDRLAALSTLSLLPGEAREAAFEAFYARYAGDHLVLDKWFALQSTIPEAETTKRVAQLMEHKDFSLANPNRVRAVVGAFANGNPTRFHALDGSGYDLLASVVLELDPKNPQLAARLLSALRSWRSLEERRRKLAEATLRRVLAAPALSADVSDIATRALG
ncbi:MULTISPECIES: aminopeptidase N [Methylosinus]|uniref:Aminopeptidase N n=1 Tax=Methylosinus trichosporium (strain ATCC 35070 / NCIMB 11131 / UNIQEM 75 / OB3b) TaxID=595536 RepID=A0A2D2D4C5_METT3|nr:MULTISPECIES: aminopeptidase N [Methylosinus]ATQ69816.1 aminopeptidase N [Methylosinus trichosporium OB3b]OBS52385.1 aminopeptidase N [Methylosinus sp. 3S-1]